MNRNRVGIAAAILCGALGLAASARVGAQDATVETAQGSFVIHLLPEIAPLHVEHFLKVAKADGFNGTTFHRIILRGIIQGGDPLSKDPKLTARYGTGGLGLLKAEFSNRPMTRGSVAAVLRPNQPNSGGDQFFICLSRQPVLDGRYTAFAQIEGPDSMETLRAIANAPRGRDGLPVKPVAINQGHREDQGTGIFGSVARGTGVSFPASDSVGGS